MPRQNGKNGVLEMRELFGMVGMGEKFLHTAHEVKTARKAFLRLASFFENERQYPELARMVKEVRRTNGQEAIVLDNGGSVEFVARSKGSGRGFTVDVLVMDEAQDLSEDSLAALLPTISAAPTGNPQQIMTGTPPGPRAVGEVFTRVRDAGVLGQDHRLGWLEWSVKGEVDLDDRSLWAATNPALGTRLGWDVVADERAAFDDETFGRERLGMWADGSASAVFGPGAWESCRVGLPSGLVIGGLAVAVSYDLSKAAIVAAAVEGDRVHVKPLQHGPGTGWVAARAKELQVRHNVAVAVDPFGPASDLIPELERAGVHLRQFKTAEVLDSCAAIFKRVQDRLLGHDDYSELNDAVKAATKRTVGDRWAWGRKQSSADISTLEAATLAAWAATQQTAARSSYEDHELLVL